MNQQLIGKIREWLDGHGYPFEMYVASIFQERGFQVAQSVYYADTDTKVSREIDVIAYKNIQIHNNWISFAFVIECKSSKQKPWLSFITNDKSKDNSLMNYYATKRAKNLINFLKLSSNFTNALFPTSKKKFSYSLTQALRDNEGNDVPYKSIQTVTKAIEDYLGKFGTDDSNNLYYYYFPVIAIDCPLFEVELLKNGEIDIQQVVSSTYMARNPKDNFFSSAIEVITKPSIKDFAEKASMQVENIISNYKNDIKTFFSSNQQ